MPFFIFFNQKALEKMIISSCNNIFIYENTIYTDIFIVRRHCVFRNFRIFPFLEKAVFSLFSSRKDAHFFIFVTQKRYRNVVFSDYGNFRKFPKISSFCIFSRIFIMRKEKILFSDMHENNLSNKNLHYYYQLFL